MRRWLSWNRGNPDRPPGQWQTTMARVCTGLAVLWLFIAGWDFGVSRGRFTGVMLGFSQLIMCGVFVVEAVKLRRWARADWERRTELVLAVTTFRSGSEVIEQAIEHGDTQAAEHVHGSLRMLMDAFLLREGADVRVSPPGGGAGSAAGSSRPG